ncbi:MAG: hypothetical protein LBL90_00075 [Prevotellaceae bacterium]|jgi:hypothetical protein|nr:hypothetical protein [Prevotellaceae bacterium]
MKNFSIKTCVPYLAAIVVFIAISILYFTPEIFQNKTLYQHDIVVGIGIGQEAKEFEERTGEKTLWTNSIFSGMPTYQISPTYPNTAIVKALQKISFLYLPEPANLVFLLLIGAFLLFVALRINPWLAILGAIAYAFSSYFFIIIQAGHIWKVLVLAYIPPTFAGILWTYKGKYWLGGTVTTLYMSLQLFSNHPQMVYYFGLVVLIFVIAQFIQSYKSKQLAAFFKASMVLLVAGGVAFAINITNLYYTVEYMKYSIRGGSELSDNQVNKTKGGLEREYVTGWSYGIGETFTLLIPNAKGGSSYEYIAYKIVDTPQGKSLVKDPAKNKDKLNEIPDPQVREYIAQQPYYWGDQPGTSGPVYVGAFIMFLFVLGIFIVHGWFKWVLVIATVLSVLLSWGSNFMWFTNLFLDYFPYYSKLRTVSSILVIAELCIPILAILALKDIVTNPAILKEKKKQFYISLACTAGLILLLIIAPGIFLNFLNRQEEAAFGEMLNNPQTAPIYTQVVDALESVRISIFRADALRSLLIICLGVLLVLLYNMKKINIKLFILAITALVLFDMWQIDKRYLAAKDFKAKMPRVKVIPKAPVDEEILKDNSLDYRVLNLAVSPFNDGSTSFYHKSVGGYHGAKLRRYQDVIERYLGGINHQNVQGLLNTKYFYVLNMLNTKYIILPGQNNAQQLLRNPNAMGNAWFVDEIKWVDNADEEIAALADINPAKTAVIDKRFETTELKNFKPNPQEIVESAIDGDSNLSGNDAYFFDTSSIKLVEYEPNKLVYESSAIAERLAVFSEVYYPSGWNIYIDGKEVSGLIRVNYILRALLVPEGRHVIEFRFDPVSYHTTENIAWIGYVLLLAFVVITIVWGFLRMRESENMADDKP